MRRRQYIWAVMMAVMLLVGSVSTERMQAQEIQSTQSEDSSMEGETSISNRTDIEKESPNISDQTNVERESQSISDQTNVAEKTQTQSQTASESSIEQIQSTKQTENASQTQQVQTDEEPEMAVECAVESEKNPLYGFASETSTTVTYEAAQRAKVPEISGPRLDNFDAGMAYLRNAFANREQHIEFGFYCDQPITDAGAVIKSALFAHTKNPIEGDSLKFQYRQYSVTRYLISSGSRYCYLLFMDVIYMTNSAEEAAVNTAVTELLDGLGVRTMDTYGKIKTIYDWICENVSYDYVHVGDSTYLKQFSAYAALIDRTAVCQGYAVLLYRLLLECGVDVRVIPGTGNGALHAWNIAAIDGVYYDLDSTWDAGRSPYGYFLCSEEDFTGHIRLDEYRTDSFVSSYPMATKTYGKTDPEKTTSEEITSEETTSEEPTSGEPTSEETTSEEPTPEETTEQNTTQEQTTQPQTTEPTQPESTTPEQTTEESTPEETTPEGDASSAETTAEQETTQEQRKPDGLVLDKNVWKYYKDGEVCTDYTGLTLYYGTWYYVEKGILNWNYTGLVLHYGTWYYVEQGRLNWNYTGLTKYYGTWYYVEKGVLNWNYTGLTKYYGTWYYIEKGRLNWNYTGLTKYYETWYYVEQGRLNWNYTGLTKYYGTWYYVEKGVLDWNYTGLTKYYGTWYYVQKGILNWNYTGTASHGGVRYYVTNGVAKRR